MLPVFLLCVINFMFYKKFFVQFMTNKTFVSIFLFAEEKGSRRSRRCDSLTSFQSLKNKQYFTRVLSDLLNQRNADVCRGCASRARPVETIMCDKLIKLEPKTESFTTPSTSSSYRGNLEGKKTEKFFYANLMCVSLNFPFWLL